MHLRFFFLKNELKNEQARATLIYQLKKRNLDIEKSKSAILFDKDGEHEMNAGDCATFKAGDNNGHAIVNKSNEDVVLLEVGTRSQKDIVHYTDKDLINDVDRTQTKQNTFKDSSGKVIYSI